MIGLYYLLEKLSGGRDDTDRATQHRSRTQSIPQRESRHRSSSIVSTTKSAREAKKKATPRSPSSPAGETLESILQTFYLSNGTLRRMITQMSSDMDRGLSKGLAGSTIAMLPSFVPTMPNGEEIGKYLAMDLGGTNLRVMLMEVKTRKNPMKTSQHNFRIPNWAFGGTGEQLFKFIVDALAEFLEEKGLSDANLPLGFTFSYPCDQTSIRKAKLIRWTKGVSASDVEGNDVVKILEDAIKKNGNIKVRVLALVNDTVGTQVATAFEFGSCDVGVIIATGTNASYLERTKKIAKLSSDSKYEDEYDYDEMVIDTEWGGFGDRGEAEYILTPYDKLIDARSVHPGVQIFDKIVAGMYMGEIVRLVLSDLVDNGILFGGESSQPLSTIGSFPTKYISEILIDEGGTYMNTRQIFDELGIEDYQFGDILIVREVCMVVSRRSANLGAAAIACIIKRLGKPQVTVGMDGSTYKYHPFYQMWVREKVDELLERSVEFKIVQASDGSGKGAALIAAIASKMNEDIERKASTVQSSVPNGNTPPSTIRS